MKELEPIRLSYRDIWDSNIMNISWSQEEGYKLFPKRKILKKLPQDIVDASDSNYECELIITNDMKTVILNITNAYGDYLAFVCPIQMSQKDLDNTIATCELELSKRDRGWSGSQKAIKTIHYSQEQNNKDLDTEYAYLYDTYGEYSPELLKFANQHQNYFRRYLTVDRMPGNWVEPDVDHGYILTTNG